MGAPEKPLSVSSFALLFGNKTLSGSLIGGISLTQEMLDFCGEHNITSDVEVTPIQKINEAYERMLSTRPPVPMVDARSVSENSYRS